MIRKFRLFNNRNDLIDFYENHNLFAINPVGLGVSLSHSYAGLNANFIHTGTSLDQGVFEIELLIGAGGNEAYQEFKNFGDFLEYSPYLLEYTTDAGTFYRECILKGLSKTEKTNEIILKETLSLECTTPFYTIQRGVITPQEDLEGDGKIYDYSFDYIYDEDVAIDNFYRLENNSIYLGTSIGSPIEIEVDGFCVNPHWDLYKDGKLIQSDGFNLTVPSGYKLIVSSFPQSQRAVLIAPNGEESNVYQQQDLTKTNFIVVPSGRTSLVFHTGEAIVRYKMREERVIA